MGIGRSGIGWLVGTLLAVLLAAPVHAAPGDPKPEPLDAAELLERGLHNEEQLRQGLDPALDPFEASRMVSLGLEELPPLPELADGTVLGWVDLSRQVHELKAAPSTMVSPDEILDMVPAVHAQLRQALAGLATAVDPDDPSRTMLLTVLSEELQETENLLGELRRLPYPSTLTGSVALGELLDGFPARFEEVVAGWRPLSGVELQALGARLRDHVEDVGGVLERPGAGPAAWRYARTLQWLRGHGFPPPSGEANVAIYRGMLQDLLGLEGETEALRAQIAALSGAAVAPSVELPPEAVAAVERTVNPRAFREPLQIPTAVQAQTPAFITWLRNIFGRYTGRAPGLRLTVAVMAGLAGLLLGWVLYLAFFGASLGRVRNARIQGAVPDEVVAGRRLLMEQQFEKALAAAAAGRLVEAWHWLAQGFIVGLAHRKLVRLDWSKTNREYVRELQSQSAALYAVARRFFGTADRVVYGGKATSVEEVRRFHDELLAAL